MGIFTGRDNKIIETVGEFGHNGFNSIYRPFFGANSTSSTPGGGEPVELGSVLILENGDPFGLDGTDILVFENYVAP